MAQEPTTAPAGVSDVVGSPDRVRDRLGLVLSGGGFRAMLFHCGALLRLIETGVLARTALISSVSGGSLTAALLAMRWPDVMGDGSKPLAAQIGDYRRCILDPLFAFSSRWIDVPTIVRGVLNPFSSAALEAAKVYDATLYRGMTFDRLPQSGPTVIICATNLSTGSSWTFSRRMMADYRVGTVDRPCFPLAQAVAASAGFPPFLAPLRVDLRRHDLKRTAPPGGEPSRYDDPLPDSLAERAVLADGGVYDNHGLEPILKKCSTVLVSDAGMPWGMETGSLWNWYLLMQRVIFTTDNQVRSLRRRQLMSMFEQQEDFQKRALPVDPDFADRFARKGTYWGMRTNPDWHGLPDALPCPKERIIDLAKSRTVLRDLGIERRRQLVNWGYAACDVRVRANLNPGPVPKPEWPYEGGLV